MQEKKFFWGISRHLAIKFFLPMKFLWSTWMFSCEAIYILPFESTAKSLMGWSFSNLLPKAFPEILSECVDLNWDYKQKPSSDDISMLLPPGWFRILPTLPTDTLSFVSWKWWALFWKSRPWIHIYVLPKFDHQDQHIQQRYCFRTGHFLRVMLCWFKVSG